MTAASWHGTPTRPWHCRPTGSARARAPTPRPTTSSRSTARAPTPTPRPATSCRPRASRTRPRSRSASAARPARPPRPLARACAHRSARPRDAYDAGWHAYLAACPAPRRRSRRACAALYDTSLMVLAASEDKTYRGAGVASPSMPWAWGRLTIDNPSDAYHLVWARDLYQVATAQLAAGDRAAAERALTTCSSVQQKPDGSFPQNSEVDGTPHWTNLQLDEVAFPIVLAWQLGRTRRRRPTRTSRRPPTSSSPTARRRRRSAGRTRAAGRRPRSRPRSPGWCAPPTSRAPTATPRPPRRYEATADDWQAQRRGLDGDDAPARTRRARTTCASPKDGTPDDAARPTRSATAARPRPTSARVVDPSFLELVRLGVKRSDDPVIRNTLKRRRRPARRATRRTARFWHRFSFDGYGESADGGAVGHQRPGHRSRRSAARGRSSPASAASTSCSPARRRAARRSCARWPAPPTTAA